MISRELGMYSSINLKFHIKTDSLGTVVQSLTYGFLHDFFAMTCAQIVNKLVIFRLCSDKNVL